MPPSELRFFGPGVDELIKNDLKLVTIRQKPKGFLPHSEVMGKHQLNERSTRITDIPITVIKEEEHPLGIVFPGLLLLDGYLNPAAAVDDMREIYNDPTWTEETPAALTLFLTRDAAVSLGFAVALLAHGTQEAAIKKGYLETTVFPAYYFWLVRHHGIAAERYPEELHTRGIISDQGVERALDHYEKYKKAKKDEDKKFHHWHFVLTG